MKHHVTALLWIAITTGLLVFNQPTVVFSAAWLTPPSHSSWYLSTFSPKTRVESTESQLSPGLFVIPTDARPDIQLDPEGVLGEYITQEHTTSHHKWLTSLHGEVGVTAATSLLLDFTVEDLKEIHLLTYTTNTGHVGAIIENDYVLLKPAFSILKYVTQKPRYNLTVEGGITLPPIRYRYNDNQLSWLGRAGEINTGVHLGRSFSLNHKNAYLELGATYHQPFAAELGGVEWNAVFGQAFNTKWSWQIKGDIKWHMPNWTFQDFSTHELSEAASHLNYYGIPLEFEATQLYTPYDEFSAMVSIIKSPKGKKKKSKPKKESGFYASYDPNSNHFSTGVMTCLWFQF